jgi:shikimate kinase
MNILLIGPRATGKSTIGRALAERLGRAFIDLDDRVRARFGGDDVRVIWATHGEPAWRATELACLISVLGEDNRVIALGGGTPMIPDAMEAIRSAQRLDRARVVYLQCGTSELVRRLQDGAGDRPSLSGGDVALETRRIIAQREPTYLELADAVVRTDRRDVNDVLEHLADVRDEW